MKSTRKTRVNDEIQKELSSIIRELKDPRIPLITSVVRVETTSDLSNCKVFISSICDDPNECMKGLNSAGGFMRSELAKRLNLRNTPILHFVNDDSIEYGAKMLKLIDEVNK